MRTRLCVAVLFGLTLTLLRCDCDPQLTGVPVPDILVRNSETGAQNHKQRVEFLFGDVDPDSSQVQLIELKNLGDAQLHIERYAFLVDPEDDYCPVPSAEFELQPPPDILESDEAKKLNLVYVPRDGGNDCAVLQILSNDPDEEQVRVYLFGSGSAPKLCTSSAVVDFGEVSINTHATQDVELSNCGTKPLTLQLLTPQRSFPPFSVETAPTFPYGPMAPGDTVTVTFGFESATPGDYTDEATSAGLVLLDTVGPTNPQSFLVLKATAVTPPACDLDVIPRQVQFGHVPPGDDRDYSAVVVNRGRLDCEIESLSHTSGSSDFTVETGAAPPTRTLAAGTQETLVFKFTPSSEAVLNAVFTLTSTDPVEPSIEIFLEGDATVPEGCQLEPDPLVLNFGNTSTAQTKLLNVTLHNIGNETCLVREASITSGQADFFTGDVGFPLLGAIVTSGGSLDIQVGFRPQSEGSKVGTLHVVYKEQGLGNPNQDLDVDLIGNAASPAICVDPEVLDYGMVSVGERPCLTFEISNCGATELTLRGVTVQSGSSRAYELTRPNLPITLQPGTAMDVEVCYRPYDGNGDLGAIEVVSDDSDDSTEIVLLHGNSQVLCPPLLACEPDLLDMGEIASDVAATRTVICTNYGTEVITVSDTSVTPAPPFAVSATTPAVLGPGDQVAVQVTFGPGHVGVFTGTVEVSSNACEPVIDIDVSVAGVEPPVPDCIPPRTFSPTEVWRWSSSSVEPQADQVWVTPMVVNMTDDNGDGLVDVNDVPDVIFSSFDHAEFRRNVDLTNDNGDHANDPIRAYLRIVSGDDGRELVAVGGEQYAMDSEVNLAVADIDGDNLPEIVGGKWLVLEGEEMMSGGPKLGGKFKYGFLIAFEHDGTFKWVSEEWRGNDDDMENAGAVSVADLDHDGFPEVIFGANVFDRNGHLLWTGAAGAANSGHGAQSFAVNLDGQGDMELICGRTVYRSDGTILWDRSDLYDANPVIADLDADGNPELVLRSSQLHILNALTGDTVAGPFDIPNPNPGEEDSTPIPTIPALADFDGDGRPEIAVPNESALSVMEMDGTVLWSADIWDGTGMAGASAFDFEGDGVYEVVYADESLARVFRGNDGTKIYEADRSSATIAEIATVADINNDGRAEIVVVSNGIGMGRVAAFTNAEGAWIGTRRIYNQQAYHVTNIDESGIVPRDEPRHWLGGIPQNSFHSNVPRCVP